MPAALPQILCLHSAGSSAAIFRVQSRALTSALRTHVSFTFIDAPFPSSLGPGLAPYASSGPFWRWPCDMAATEAFDVSEQEVEDERTKCRDMLMAQMESMPNLVGIMAFSQGARALAGLLLYLTRTSDPILSRIRFAIVCCATYPPLWIDAETEKWVRDVEGDALVQRSRIQVPSLHLLGSKDAWRGEAETMAREAWSDTIGKQTFEFEGGHQVPLGKEDAGKVSAWVRQFLSTAR